MIILSKLADYGVIIATHLAVHPERQMTAAALAEETRLPRATVAKLLKSIAHHDIVAGARGAAGGYRLSRPANTISVAEVVAAIAPQIAERVRPGGDVVASGIIRERQALVEQAFEAVGLTTLRVEYQGEWVVIEARKPEDFVLERAD